jgi:RNA polymerase sigma factor (sigma-70 family)
MTNHSIKNISDEHKRQIERLYIEYGPIILGYLKNTFNIPKQQAENCLQDTFVKAISKIDSVKGAYGEKSYKCWIFEIAKNVAKNYIKEPKLITNYERSQDNDKQYNGDDPFDNIEDAKNAAEEFQDAKIVAEEMEKELCLQLCMKKALDKYIHDYPHALRPLLVTLSDKKFPIEEIAAIICQTVPETQEHLKRCRKEMKHYKDYSEYQKRHGLESLCLLIVVLKAIFDWNTKEIEQIIGKKSAATRKTGERCFKLMSDSSYFKECWEDCK